MAEDYNKEPETRSEEVSMWQDRISTAFKRRDDIAVKNKWEDMIDKVNGVWKEIEGYSIPILPLNLLHAFVKTELPALYIRDPQIKANPKKRTTIWRAKVLEAVINYLWRVKDLKREIKKCIADALIIGHAWFKVGYTGEFGTIEMNDQETQEYIESEDFFGYRVPWKNIVFDCDSIDPPHDCSWICHSVWLPIEEVKKNERYKNTDKIRISEERKYSAGLKDKQNSKVRVDEVWDIKNKQVFTVSEGVDDYLEEPKPWPYEMKGYPFSYLQFNKINDEPYGNSDIAMFYPQILELMKLRSAMLDHLKRYGRQMQADQSVDDNELAKLTDGICGAIVKGDLSKGDIVKPINYPQLQPDAYAIEERLKEDAIRISGQTPLEQGGTAKTTTRAVGELNLMQEGATNRRADKVDSVESFMEDIARNLVALVKQLGTTPYYIRILGINSPELQKAIAERPSVQGEEAITDAGGFTFTKEDIQGEYDISIVAGSSTPLNKQARMNTIMSALELLPRTGVTPGSPVYGVFGRILAEEFDMPEILQAIEQEAQRQAQLMQQQQEQAKQMQQIQAAQMGAENQIKAEQAATKQIQNQTDLIKFMLEQKANKQNQGQE